MLYRWLAVIAALVTALPGIAQLEDFDQTLERVQQLVREHRYQQVVDMLQPLEGLSENPEIQFIVAAELGRSHFHLGNYAEAHQRLRSAVSMHPERVETALYLEATAYLLGDRNQALGILREVLRARARDRYLAVTLPGERGFLGDPEVWRLLEEYSEPLQVDLEAGRIAGIGLGSDRPAVARAVGAPRKAATDPRLLARAGPYPIWSFEFSESDAMTEAVLYNENLAKYTPYRLEMGPLTWRTNPAEVVAVLGPPDDTGTVTDQGFTMAWHRADHTLAMVFGHPRPPRPPALPPDTAMLLAVRFAGRTDGERTDSDSMRP